MAGSPAGKASVSEYRLSMHFGICHGPVDLVTRLQIGDKDAWVGTPGINDGYIEINNKELFGGIQKEGGVQGLVEILSGHEDQILNPDVAARLGGTPTTVPGFRGILSAFFKNYSYHTPGFYWSANSPYLKNPAFTVKRSPKGLYPEKAMIGDDANPAHIIFECLTNDVWGMGGSSAILDLDSFTYSADIFFAENLGLTMMWTGQTTIESFVQEVLDHVEATFFLHPATGLLTLKPIRQDYDIDDLFLINEDNAMMLNFQRKGWGETINEINASWTNPVNEQEENVTVHSLGNIAAQGSISSDGRNYYGARSSELALRLATRDLNASSYPIASVDIAVNREAWDKVPGEVIKLTWPRHGLLELPMRVGQINYGRPNNSKIVITLVEDVFAIPSTSYVEAPDSEWEDPSNPPEVFAFSKVFNIPYNLAARVLGDTAAEALPYPQQYAAALGAQDKTDTLAFDLYSERVNTVGDLVFERVGTLSLSGRGETSATNMSAAASSPLPTIINFWGVTGPEVETFVMFGTGAENVTEIAVVESIVAGVPQLRRGVLDTIPRAWPIGTPVWFFRSGGAIYDTGPHAAGETIPYKMLPRTSGGLLPEEEAPEIELVISDRLHKPLRPANVRLNGTAFGPATMTAAAMTGMTVSWSRRNRLVETAQILSWLDAGVTPEVGQTTTVQIRGFNNAILETVTGITGESLVTTFNPASVVGGGIYVDVWSVRDGIASLQTYRATVQLV